MKTKSLQHYVNMSWLISGLLALIATLILFVGFGTFNYLRDSKLSEAELKSHAQFVARRLSGELLLGDRGAPNSVSLQLAKDLKLAEINFGSKSEIENLSKSSSKIYSISAVPFLEDKFVVRVSQDRKSVFEYFNFSVMFICFTIIGVLIGVGIYIQTKYLKKHLVDPIQALVHTSTGERLTSGEWPEEIQAISDRLNNSFQNREQFVYSQIARGVIHDIKTILQSLKAASDLASENQSESRMNNLLKVTQLKLPSLLEIVDTTLDGSREIAVKKEKIAISATVERSINTIKSLQFATNIDFVIDQGNITEVAHDSIQLERVFTNLIKNGIESINELDYSRRKIKVSFSEPTLDFVKISIEDSGKGLPENADSVFRLLKSTKSHGSGIGLLVSKKIVEAHHGKLVASHSQELGGAQFDVILPKGELV